VNILWYSDALDNFGIESWATDVIKRKHPRRFISANSVLFLTIQTYMLSIGKGIYPHVDSCILNILCKKRKTAARNSLALRTFETLSGTPNRVSEVNNPGVWIIAHT
jgi:hypothetical protein